MATAADAAGIKAAVRTDEGPTVVVGPAIKPPLQRLWRERGGGGLHSKTLGNVNLVRLAVLEIPATPLLKMRPGLETDSNPTSENVLSCLGFAGKASLDVTTFAWFWHHIEEVAT